MKGVKISRIMILLTIIGGIFLYACSGGGNPQAGKDGADAGQVLSGSIAEGDKCSADAECVDGLLCISDRCAKPGGVKEEGICTTDVECEDGLNCLNNICSKLSEDQVAPLDEDQVTPPDKWTLYVSKPINGLVTTDENDGINCGDVCSKSYDRNQAVKLLAEPAQGYVFDGWSGDCSGKDLAIEITMNSNKKCSASFSEVGITGYNLIIQKPNNGMVVSEPEGINCGSSEANCLKKFEVNAEIKLSAVPSDGYGFDGWSGDCSGGDFVIIKMDSEKTCSAKFSKLNPTNGFLTVQKIGKGIIKSSDGINCETEAICERAYEFKTNIKLTAAPAEGYKFDLWSGACTGTNSIVDITIEGPKTCTANFSKIQHQLIITKSEGGLVTSSPMGINCGALGEECSKLFDFGTEVVLSAVSDANYQFNGWLGDCSGVDIAIFTMNSEKTCSAKFSKKQSSVYTIAVQKVGKGKITSMDVLGKQVNCGDICTLSFDQETPITLFAWAENGYEFVSWSGDCSGSETEISLVLNSPKTCVATFKNIKYHLNIIKKEGGEIISDPSGINCGDNADDCVKFYNTGTEVILMATPSVGYVFDTWTGDCVSDKSIVSVVIDKQINCYPFFKKLYTLTVVKMGKGFITSEPAGINCGETCSGIYKEGTNVVLTAKSETGWKFDQWQVWGSENPIVLTMGADHLYNAIFSLEQPSGQPPKEPVPAPAPETDKYTVTINVIGGGKVTSDISSISCPSNCTATLDKGLSMFLTAQPDAGWMLESWSGNCTPSENNAAFIQNISSDKTCTATFAKIQYKLYLSASIGGEGFSITPNPLGTSCGPNCYKYEKETSVAITAKFDKERYDFLGWLGDCSGADFITTIIMEADKNCNMNIKNKPWLQVFIPPEGLGTIISNPPGIDCGSDCNEFYQMGTTVKLTVTPADGYKFTGWSGDCSGINNSTTISLSDANNKYCGANVKPLSQFKLIVGKGNNGLIISSPEGIMCGTDGKINMSNCNEYYSENTEVTLTVTPLTGYKFISWSGSCVNSGSNQTSLKMNSDKQCTANYSPIKYKYTLVKEGNGSGTVTSVPAGINCGTICEAYFDYGTFLDLNYIADAGSVFSGWDCTFTVKADTICKIKFAKLPVLHIVKQGSGTVTSLPDGINCGSNCSSSFPSKTLVKLTAVPDANWKFDGWGGDCSTVYYGPSLNYVSTETSVSLSSDKACTAVFSPVQYELDVYNQMPDRGYVISNPEGISCGNKCSYKYNIGTNVVLKAVANSGYKFNYWREDGSPECSGEKSATVTLKMDQYKKCIPLFTYRDQALIITKTGFGTVTSSDQKINCGSDCNGTYPYGTKVTLTAIPDPNRKFISWGDGCGVSYLNKNDPTITVTMDKTANCVANFSNGYLLTIQKEGSGTVTGAKDKLNCGSTCVAEFSAGSNFNIYAKEDPGWVLVKWEGDCSGSISNANITMDKDKTCKVIFTNQFQFYTSVIKGGGKITSSDGKINCNTAEACSAVYTSGTQVTLTATPDSGKKFDYWSGVCTGTNPTITTTVTLNKKYCYAYFK